MRYQQTNHPTQAAANYLSHSLGQRLAAGQHVLWLLSGGSSLDIATLVSGGLGDALDSGHLAITMTDERYGPVGHADENWQLLLDSGFLLPGAELYRPLSGGSRQQTTADFEAWLQSQLKIADYKIGIFGIGTDGHTAGIKPNSPAIDSSRLAIDFSGDDFERITMTPPAIRQLDEGVIQVSGQDKAAELKKLLGSDLPIDQQPAQVLKSLPRATIFTDLDPA